MPAPTYHYALASRAFHVYLLEGKAHGANPQTLWATNMLTEFHKAALTFMLDHPDDQHLREQIPYVSLVETDHTGVGCFYTYEVSTSASLKFDLDLEYLIDLGKTLYAKELSDDASMILHVRKGKIDVLEILAHGDNYPELEPTEYRFENTPYKIIDQREIQ